MYAWTITQDKICDGEEAGTVGPYDASMSATEISSHPDREYIALGFKGCLAHVFTTTGMRLAISPETYDRAREALKGVAGVTITE